MNEENKEFPLEETIFYCPQCSRKLFSPKGIIALSLPPKMEVRCLNCDYKGYRIIINDYEKYFIKK